MQPTRKLTNFLTTDILITDIVVPVNAALQELLTRYYFSKGSKAKITIDQMPEFMAAITSCEHVRFPGGSASNMIRTIASLAPNLVKGRFIGTCGNDTDGQMIVDSFKKAKVQLDLITSAIAPQTAISFVIKYPDGERTIVTFPGNARDIIKPQHFTQEDLEETDCFLLQGSIRSKLIVSVTDTILKHRWNLKKPLVLALPTSAFEVDYFKWAQASANVILSNTDELGFIMGVPVKDTRDALEKSPDSPALQNALTRNIEEAISRLQKQQREHSNRVLERIGHAPQIAMITDDKNGAWLVTSDKVTLVPSFPIDKIVGKLGAGDNSFAGFTFAKYVLGMSDIDSVGFAMITAAAKLQFDGPVMPDPMGTIAQITPKTAQEITNMILKLQAGSSLTLH